MSEPVDRPTPRRKPKREVTTIGGRKLNPATLMITLRACGSGRGGVAARASAGDAPSLYIRFASSGVSSPGSTSSVTIGTTGC